MWMKAWGETGKSFSCRALSPLRLWSGKRPSVLRIWTDIRLAVDRLCAERHESN